jgi:hypothetical protein
MRNTFAPLLVSLLLPVAFACSSEPAEEGSGCEAHSDCGGDAPFCGGDGACTTPPPGSELGWEGGSLNVTVVASGDVFRRPTDVEWNPSAPDEAWIVNYADDSVAIVSGLASEAASVTRLRDPAASHFMRRPPALAMGQVLDTYGQTFGVCGDGDNGGNDFMGPALFTTDLDIFAKQTEFGLGSHLDMLHSTSFCRGIAWDQANVYYAFNSVYGSIDQYDFAQDHGPGYDDHSDGSIFRLVAGELAGVDGIPSHVTLHQPTRELFVADTGNGRIVAVKVDTGTPGTRFGNNEPIVERRNVEGVELREVVPPGLLQQPSGIELLGDVLFVSDHATSRFHAFDLDGKELASLEVPLPPGSLAGFAFGPDGKLYFVDMVGNQLLRVDAGP